MAVYFDQNGNLVDTEINESSNVFMEDPTENFYQPRMDISPTQDFYQPRMDISPTQDFYQPQMDISPTQDYYAQRNFINAPQNYYQPDLTTLRGLDMNRFQGVSDRSIIDETTNDEQDQNYIDQVSKNKSTGIMDLIMSIAVPGYGFLKNIGRGGLEGIRGLNQRIQQSDFGQAKNLSDYFDMRSYGGLRERENKSAQTMAQARGIQKQMAQRPSATPSARDLAMGRGEGDGPQKDAAATRSRDLGSMRGAVGR